ncbi:unnamed protein product [Calicophoron daubneyi]|uniref:Uncharacterized protein n=1 Tax=Calicophoron daubneyi TaxID=300641 RepID=A0AAV2TFM1_CALDB
MVLIRRTRTLGCFCTNFLPTKLLVLCLSCLLFFQLASADAPPKSPQNMNLKELLDNLEVMKQYLKNKEVERYLHFQLHGRPRFGKRSGRIWNEYRMVEPTYESPPPIDTAEDVDD